MKKIKGSHKKYMEYCHLWTWHKVDCSYGEWLVLGCPNYYLTKNR